jgi:CMP-N-acetylneuraminic acid synthetase
VSRKNIKAFAGYKNGLIQIKLAQLTECSSISEIVLSTNDEEILQYAESLESDRLRIHVREDRLSSSSTSTDELVELARSLVRYDHILWTHVTSPFFTSTNYADAISAYMGCLAEGYDSLMTVKRLQGFYWNKDGPINYDRSKEKWPRTQTLDPLYEVDSAVFLSSKDNYASLDDRIGLKPYLLVPPGVASFDIDWPEDFAVGEMMLRNGLASV